ncbi:FIG00784264: hypothetical protein [hydrothermal vent metagenome]|uniref:N-acetyltransferase domain-containing protein n=1 Tax=hydrothermal vent metagenome TaxID=652676 RepID=A0A3B1B4F8_9ZZZZ
MAMEELNAGNEPERFNHPGSAEAIIDYFKLEDREVFLKKFGVHSQSFTTLQPGLSYLDMPSVGYMAYAQHYGVTIVLSDPVCAESHLLLMIQAFQRHFPDAIYLQVSSRLIDILKNELGFYVSKMGIEYKIPLEQWESSGRSKKTIRTAVNQAVAQGIDIKETIELDKFEKISEQWLCTRACKVEIEFLIRPLNMAYTSGVRCFVAYQNNQPVGFILFDPIYKNENVIAYIPNVSRSWQGFQQGLWYAMMDKAIQTFRREKIQYIDLGLTPLSELDSAIEAHESKLLRYLLRFIYRYGGFLYNFKGLEFAKARYKGRKEIIYVGHRYRFPVWALIAVFRKARIL